MSPQRGGQILGSAALFVVVSALAGLLVAGLALPLVGGIGVGSRAASGVVKSLPAEFETPPQSQRSKIVDVNGDELAYFYDENRVYRPLIKISPLMRRATVAIEDHRFYQHGPLDATGTLRAFLNNLVSGGVTQGGSSLSQQYVKLVLIDQAKRRGDAAAVKAAQASTYERKIQELRYAVALEQRLSKDEILERYLNLAYFGAGTYGVEAAARHYFGTTASELTLAQAAMLAGLVQNPTQINPITNKAAALERRDVVINRMAELGLISSTDKAKAKKTGFEPVDVQPTRNGCVGTDYPFLCRYVYDALLQTPSLGTTVAERADMIKRGGLTVRTAIDPRTQDLTQRTVSNTVGPTDPVIATMNMIEPGTGLIIAMAQSRPVMGDDSEAGETYWNYATGEQGGFQAGSTFKAITSAAALEKGIPLSKRYDARATMNFGGRRFDTCDGRGKVYGDWRVSNSTDTNGVMDMYRAAQRSVNTYYVQLELDTGMCPVITMAEKLGIVSTTADRPLRYYQDKPSFTLGTVEISPLSLAEAYATFASGGIHCDPIIIDSIIDHRRRDAGRTEWELPAGDQQGRRERDERSARRRDDHRHRATGPDRRRSPAGREDRHHQRQSGRHLRRLHTRGGRRRDDLGRRDPRAVRQGWCGLPPQRDQGLPGPVHRIYPRRLREWRCRRGDLETGDGAVSRRPARDRLRASAGRADRGQTVRLPDSLKGRRVQLHPRDLLLRQGFRPPALTLPSFDRSPETARRGFRRRRGGGYRGRGRRMVIPT